MKKFAHALPALLILGLIQVVMAVSSCTAPDKDLAETGIAELHDRMLRGEVSSAELVDWYIDRVAAIDAAGPTLNAIIEINPDARDIARSLDEEWRSSGPRGPMHGIPVILKANIDTADRMSTSAGSLALADHVPNDDAFIVQRLRDAGAVILGKANLSEWANFRSSRSSSGWSSVGGQTRNPYDTTRTPCGSSSGSAVAVAASMTSVAIGTETDGSIVCPSGINGIVGIKPTLGLLSRSGIIPIAHSQDTAGPMARSVRDAAILLTIIAGPDADDPATGAALADRDYATGLAADGLDGKRIGALRSFYGAGSNPHVEEIYAASLDAMRAQGAIIVDDIEIDTAGMGDAEYEVLLYEFKADLNAYLQQSGAPVASLGKLVEWNAANAEVAMPVFGQDIFIEANDKGPLTDGAYVEALEQSKRIARDGLDAAMAEHDLDAIVAPTNGPAWKIDHVNGDSFHVGSSSLTAVSGYPSVTVPAGFVSGLPIGLSFMGRPWNEKQLIEIAFAFEQATRARRKPDL